VEEHTAYMAKGPAKRDRAMEKEKQAAEGKPVKVIEVDLDSDDEEEQPVKRTATAKAVGATVQKERDVIEKDENLQTPIQVKQIPAKETHGGVETGSHGESDKGAERRYPTQERKVPEGWFRANMAAGVQRGPTGPKFETKNGLEKGPVVDCVGVVDPRSGPTRPTLDVEKGLEKGQGVHRVEVVDPTRGRQPRSKNGANRTENVWVTPRAKERADNKKG
jgi:hypothetical protein